MNDKRITVGDLKEAIKDLPDDLPLIYSHDDEGNEHQYVIYSPSIMYVEKTEGYRFLDIIEDDDPKEIEKGIKCLCIN